MGYRLFIQLCRWCVLLSLVVYQISYAQGTMVTLEGRIQSEESGLSPGTLIELVYKTDGRRFATNLNSDGTFRFLQIPEGPCVLRFSAAGFAPVTIDEGIKIEPGTRTLRLSGSDFLLGRRAIIRLSVIPLVNPPPDSVPVYNAVFDGAETVKPLRLADAKLVTLRFYIGPKDEQSSLAQEKWTVNPKILQEAGKLDVTVDMYCDVCTQNRFQKDAILYDGKLGRSTEASFKIEPTKTRTKEGLGKIILNISRRGQEFDNLTIDVAIGDSALSTSREPTTKFDPPTVEQREVDLVITADTDPSDHGQIIFTFEPVEENLKSKIHKLCIAQDKSFRRLSAGRGSAKVTKSITRDVYLELRAFASPLEDALRKQLNGRPGGVLNLDNLDKMPEGDANKLLEAIIKRPRTLYADLFLKGDADLRTIIDAVESTQLGRRLRIVMKVGNLALPWQLLHPPGELNALSIWGFKYELAVVPLRQRPGAITSQAPKQGEVAFALYGNKKKDELVFTLGRKILKAFEVSSQSRNSRSLSSKEAFMKYFTQSPNNIGVLITYTHAHSGIAVAEVIGPDAAGPRIEFSDNNYVGVKDLHDTVSSTFKPIDYSTRFFLGQRPLVILNACETAPSTVSGSEGDGFPETFLWLGARGVIATEGPVPAYFGYFFGKELLSLLKSGAVFPEAVTKLRSDMWEKGNPLGLLYSYYGSPHARGI